MLSRNWATHGETYKTKCEDNGVSMHPGVENIPVDTKGGPRDGDISKFMRPASKWTKEGLMEHLIELVVVEDKVCARSSHCFIFRFITHCRLSLLLKKERSDES